MKNLIIISLFLLHVVGFAQKNEMKSLEKAIKKNDFSSTTSLLSTLAGMEGNMDAKTLPKYLFLKGQALYANGSTTPEKMDMAIETFSQLKELEAKSGKSKYSPKVNPILNAMLQDVLTKGQSAYEAKDWNAANEKFNQAYKLSPNDTIYLYYAATMAVSIPDYGKAVDSYVKLKDIGYTGITSVYTATNVESGEDEPFTEKNLMDISVKAGTHKNPRSEKTQSKRAEIIKNIALIYIQLGKKDLAESAIKEARAENPKDVPLLMTEANFLLEQGDREQFKKLMQEAVTLDPNNPELYYNLGVLATESKDKVKAHEYYTKAIEINPKYIDAYLNLAALELDRDGEIIEELNNLGSSAADDRRYEELSNERVELMKKIEPLYKKIIEIDPKNVSALSSLKGIYGILGNTEKIKEIKSILESL